MSRKFLNDRFCVRCNKTSPCPYLRDNYGKIKKYCNKNDLCVDIGCGNGRNSEFMKENGFENILSFDMVGDYGDKLILGREKFPVSEKTVKLFLCNYSMMFLNDKEREQVISEIKRTASDNAVIILELYPSVNSFAKTEEAMLKMQKSIFKKLGWDKIRYSKGRFLAINKVNFCSKCNNSGWLDEAGKKKVSTA